MAKIRQKIKYTSTLNFAISDTLRADWQRLWDTCSFSTVNNSPAWFEAYVTAFEPDTVCILTISGASDHRLKAVVPLIQAKAYGMTTYTSPGVNFIDRSPILVDLTNKAIVAEITLQLQKLGTVYICGFTGEESTSLSRCKGVTTFPVYAECVMDFSRGTYGEFPAKTARKYMHRAERFANADIKMKVTTDAHESALTTCFEIDRNSAKQQRGKGTFDDANTCHFYMLLAQKAPALVKTYILTANSKPIAFLIQFSYRNVLTGSQKAYLYDYGEYKPGYLLYIKLFDLIRADKSVECTFGKGLDEFKKRFTTDIRTLHACVISRNPFARLYIGRLTRAKETAYEIVSKYPRAYTLYKGLKGSTSNNTCEL